MLKKIVDEKWLTARAVIGFWPANSLDDDILIYGDKARKFPIHTLHTLRQQMAREAGRPNLALSDFIAPAGREDYIGGFVVTAGIGEEPHVRRSGSQGRLFRDPAQRPGRPSGRSLCRAHA